MIKKLQTPPATVKKILQPFQKEKDFFDFVLLMAFVFGKSKEWILAHPEENLTPDQEKRLLKLIKRRLKGEPLAYLLGKKEFFSLPFFVNRNTLIPRPETELLAEKALEITNHTSGKKLILDIGTGSGCIIISLAYNLKRDGFSFLANDFSSAALKVAQKNSQLNRTDDQIDFFTDDLLGKKTQKKIKALVKKEKISEIILLANLPYISQKDYQKLDKTVKNFEPPSALLSGEDGLDHYQKLFSQLKNLKKYFPVNKIVLLIEFGWQQKTGIKKNITQNFPSQKPEFFKDLAGHWRNAKIEI